MGTAISSYTLNEHDKAVGMALGAEYGITEDPGCHLTGVSADNPQNIFELNVPGKYTLNFYIDIAVGNVPVTMPFEGSNPIVVFVFTKEDCLYQHITIGAILYYRDLNSGDYAWNVLDLGVQAVDVIDNLLSTRPEAALSANMGRVIKNTIDTLSIGNMNLIDNSAMMRDASCWLMPTGTARVTSTKFTGKPTISLNSSSTSSDTDVIAIVSTNAHRALIKPNVPYTFSVYVNTATDSSMILQMAVFDTNGISITSERKTFVTTAEEQPTWKRVSITLIAPANANGIDVMIASTGRTAFSIALPKLEEGTYATAWCPSYYDMWCEFDNANFINEVFVDADTPSDHEGLIYNGTTSQYENTPVAIGGGGGFVMSVEAPLCTEVLWYKTPENKLYRWDTTASRWVRALPNVFVKQSTAPTDLEVAWLDDVDETNIKSATLKYYDTIRSTWRPVGSAPTGVWEFSETAPVNQELMWVQLPSLVPYLFYDGEWLPLHSIWGKNITST